MDISTAACPNCKAPLRIVPETDNFRCGYCGTQLSVNRGGGNVSLSRVEASLGRIETGMGRVDGNTSRTASELALQRLRREQASIKDEITQMKKPRSRILPLIGLIGFGILLLIYVCAAFTPASNSSLARDQATFNLTCGGTTLLATFFFGFQYWQLGKKRSAYDQQMGELNANLKRVEDQLQFHRQNAEYNH